MLIYNLWDYKITIKENMNFEYYSCEFSFGNLGN